MGKEINRLEISKDEYEELIFTEGFDPVEYLKSKGFRMSGTSVGVFEDFDTGTHIFIEDEIMTEQEKAQHRYPNHAPETALANYRSGREVWDTNGDMW